MKSAAKKIFAVMMTALLCFSLFCMTAFADGEVASAAADAEPDLMNQWLGILIQIGPIVLIVVVFYFLLIRPQKKQEKETQAMRNSISVGDTVTTIGGITGTIIAVKENEDSFVLETGADRNRITIRKWAVQTKDKSAQD